MMTGNDAAAMYHQVSSHGRSPVGMIVALYDTILRDLRRALAALDAGNVEARVFELNHAIAVIGHLEETLDHERGGQAAKRFEQFYKVTRAMIVSANTQANRKPISELVELYRPMREAWHQAEQKLPAEVPGAATPAGGGGGAPRKVALAMPPAMFEPEPPRGKWSA